MVTETEDEEVAIFRIGRGQPFAMNNNFKPAARPSAAAMSSYLSTSKNFTPWGNDNMWPCKIMDALMTCAPAQVCIEFLVAMFYGNGPVIKQEDAQGNVTEVYNQAQKNFLRQSYIYQYLPEAATDYFGFANQWAQIIRNQNDTKPGFAFVANISAPFCRQGIQTKGIIQDVHINGSWDQMPGDDNIETVRLLNRFDAADIIAENPKTKKFMWRSGRYTPGRVFYDEAAFHALVRNGTMDVFAEIPKIRKRRIKDAMFIKYHVRIHEMYWYLKYGGIDAGKTVWEGMSKAARKAARNKLYTEIDEKLTGSTNAFKSFFTPTWTDKNGTEIKLITIEKIEIEVGESAAFGPDGMGATAEVILAFGLPSAAVNTVLSDSKSRGGGSDIQESNNSIVARMPLIRHNILEPVEFAMRNTFVGPNDEPLLLPNQWIDMDNLLLTRLDQNKNGVQSTDNAKTKPDTPKP